MRKLRHLPRRPLFDQLLRPHRGRDRSGIGTSLGRAAIAGQRRFDFLRLGHRRHQRLVAIDVLLMPDGGEQGVFVQVVGRADVDDVDRRILGDSPVDRSSATSAPRVCLGLLGAFSCRLVATWVIRAYSGSGS